MKFLKTKFGKFVAVASTSAVAVGTAAADVATDITTAFTAAESNVTLAAGGLIGVVAIMTGIGFIISLLKR